MNDNRINFTEATVRDLPFVAPNSKRVDYYDAKLRGLQLRVSSSSKAFYVYRKHQGRPLRVKLGEFPGISVEKARQLAGDVLYKLSKGENPNLEKRAIRTEMTFGELFRLAMETDFKLHNKSWREQDARYKRQLSEWENRRISSITRQAVHTMHVQVANSSGPYEANRVLSLISRLYNIARIRGFEQQNPALGVKKFREHSRERFLQAEELPRFFQAVYAEENPDVRDFVLLALFTGARKRNVLSMRWEDLNLDRGMWTIPAEKTKNGNTATVPLSQSALNVLRFRLTSRNESPYVFAGPGVKGHLNDPKKGWERILERAEIKSLRIHDLRRTFGSWQAATGASLTVIGKSLSHRSLAATQVYARLELDPVRAAVEKATEAMLTAAERNNDSRVVPFTGVNQEQRRRLVK